MSWRFPAWPATNNILIRRLEVGPVQTENSMTIKVFEDFLVVPTRCKLHSLAFWARLRRESWQAQRCVLGIKHVLFHYFLEVFTFPNAPKKRCFFNECKDDLHLQRQWGCMQHLWLFRVSGGIKLRIDQRRGYSMMLASFVESCWFECGLASFDLQLKTYAEWAEFMDGILFVSWFSLCTGRGGLTLS